MLSNKVSSNANSTVSLKYGKAAYNAMYRNARVQKQWCQK